MFGVAGDTGKELILHLLARGHEVTAVVRRPADFGLRPVNDNEAIGSRSQQATEGGVCSLYASLPVVLYRRLSSAERRAAHVDKCACRGVAWRLAIRGTMVTGIWCSSAWPFRAALIFAGLTLAAANPVQAKCSFGIMAKLPVTMEAMRASVPVVINGKQTSFWLDSGAFFSFMSKAKATELGLKLVPLPMGFHITGIGGSVSPEYTTVKSFGLVGNSLANVDFIVGGSDAGNGMLGLNLLSIGDAEYDLANGVVNLIHTQDCQKSNLAYWAGGKTISAAPLLPGDRVTDHHIYASGAINGRKVRLMFDTGAPSSILTRAAAQELGIDMTAPDVVASAEMGGIGTKGRKSWIVKLDSFAIGGEEIRHSPIRVIDDQIAGTRVEVVLGADFFLAHHVLVSRSQHLIYMTYNGGPIFSLSTEQEIGHQSTRAENMGGADNVLAPSDADGFARRGYARAARSDYAGAIADLTEALRQSPGNVEFLRNRARAYSENGQQELAHKDIDTALQLAPNERALVMSQALQRLAEGDSAGALADAEAAAKLTPVGSLDNIPLLVLFERLHRPERNLALLDPIIALHKEDHVLGSLLNARCWARGLANVDLGDALADCNAAIRRDGPKPAYLDSRALIRLRQKDYGAALVDYDAALAGGSNVASSLFLRGVTKVALGKQAAGAADIAAAKQVDPAVAERFVAFGLGG